MKGCPPGGGTGMPCGPEGGPDSGKAGGDRLSTGLQSDGDPQEGAPECLGRYFLEPSSCHVEMPGALHASKVNCTGTCNSQLGCDMEQNRVHEG